MSENAADVFRQVFDRYYNRLIYHALRFVDNEAEAEDVVEDAFCELWRNREAIDFQQNIQSYLYRAVSTRALNVLRHKGVAATRIELMEQINVSRMEYMASQDGVMPIETEELRRELNEAIAGLPDKCREVFKLSYMHGLKNSDIADAMDVSVRTVEAHMYKALRMLREKLRHLLAFLLFFTTFY